MTGTHPSPTDPQTRPQPVDNLVRPCPTCGARPTEPCLTVTGMPMDETTHQLRPKPRKPRRAAPSRTTRAAAPSRKGPTMSEDELGRQVAKLAKRGGWRSNHHRRSRRADGGWETATSVPGWPDLVLWKPGPGGGVLFRELKATRGVLSDKQAALLEELRRSGADAKCWWPDALYSGEIEATLCGHLEDAT